jgi:VWFA-related protein
VHIRQILALGLVCLLTVSLVQAQLPPSEEIHIVSQTFVPQVEGTIRVESAMVPVTVVVRDAHGKPVDGLKKEDFEVYDDGKPQAISIFSVETAAPPPPTVVPTVITTAPPTAPPAPPQPRYVGMYFDDNNMKTPDLVFVRKAAQSFIQKNIGPTDRVAIFTSSTTVTRSFTSDKQQLYDTLAQLTSHFKTASFGAMACPQIDAYQAFQIEEFQNEHSPATDLAIAQAIACNPGMSAQDAERLVETQAATVLSLANQFARDSLGVLGDVIRYMGKMPGKRMLVMASSGFFSKSAAVQHDQDKMIDAALHAGIVINTLDAKGLAADWEGGDPANGPPIVIGANGTGPARGDLLAFADEVASDERDVTSDSMAVLAQATGGKFFHNSNDMTGGLVEIAAVPAVSYVLGFSPDLIKDNGSYHNLKVRLVNKPSFSISARPGYFAPAKEKAVQVERFQRLNKEVMSSEILTGVSADVSTQSGKLGSGESILKVSVHVDVKGFPFKKEDKLHVDRLIYITALFDLQGNFLGGVEGIMDMRMKDATYKDLLQTGATGKLSIQAPPGSYRLREVVQEVAGGRFATITQPVEIQ